MKDSLESILAVRISEIASAQYTVTNLEAGNARLHIGLKNGKDFEYNGTIDQVRKRFDYLVNKLPEDTKEFLILNNQKNTNKGWSVGDF